MRECIYRACQTLGVPMGQLVGYAGEVSPVTVGKLLDGIHDAVSRTFTPSPPFAQPPPTLSPSPVAHDSVQLSNAFKLLFFFFQQCAGTSLLESWTSTELSHPWVII